jgi:hypothetical protein
MARENAAILAAWRLLLAAAAATRRSFTAAAGLAVLLLGETCGCYSILARVRNCPGVTPMRRLKWRQKALSVRCRVFSEDPAHLANDLQVVLAEVAGGDDSLRRRAGAVSALIADQSVGPLVGWRVGEVPQLASALGREFGYELLAAVANLDEPAFEAELTGLVRAEILHPTLSGALGCAAGRAWVPADPERTYLFLKPYCAASRLTHATRIGDSDRTGSVVPPDARSSGTLRTLVSVNRD